MTTRKTQAAKATDTPDTPPDQGAKEAEKKEMARESAAKDGTPDTKRGAKQGSKEKRDALRVRALGERFRRAGLAFGRNETVLYVDELSDDQVAALKAEPRLVVIEDRLHEQVETGDEE
ncbi:HI1506-related protein [Halomonas sp.]|uniref:HI1506-related protein n=1 Tax=Halomonas sp. TaxID=1486246 RepID=UPI00257C71B1|nr:HI1506-related protein [Halomonas sp.]MCJ8285108.1 HI1506-related protein [Halomonas sp.]NQY70158.1 hypothetical protein [Halomonas sp.]